MSEITKRAFASSLKKMLAKRPLEKIRVIDITEDCGVNRQTFYYHFKDIYDLLEWVYTNEATKALGGKKTYETWQQGFKQIFQYILNNKEGISNLYKYQSQLHGCSAEGHVSHLYSARLSSRPLGWKTINVNNVSKLRLIKADNKEIKEIVHNKRKVIEFKEIEKIRHVAKEKIKESINFKVGTIPVMEFGTTEQRKFFKQLLEYKKAV